MIFVRHPKGHFADGVNTWLSLDTYGQSDLTTGVRCRQVRWRAFVVKKELWRWSIRAACFRGLNIGDTRVIDQVQGAEFFSKRLLAGPQFPNY